MGKILYVKGEKKIGKKIGQPYCLSCELIDIMFLLKFSSMKKLSKISLEEKMKKLDQLSVVQLEQLEGGDSIHFDPPPYTPTPPCTFQINPFGGSYGIGGGIAF